jgi:hypothetical protein
MGQIEEAAQNLPEAQRHYHLAKDVLDTFGARSTEKN